MQPHELPPPAQMVLLLGRFRFSQALYAAAALGVADHLVAGPAPAEVLAERAPAMTARTGTQRHEPGVQSTCRFQDCGGALGAEPMRCWTCLRRFPVIRGCPASGCILGCTIR